MRSKRMADISLDSNNFQIPHHHHGPAIEEIQGLISVFKDGCVERTPIIHTVSSTTSDPATVAAKDVKVTDHVWTRVYVPVCHAAKPVIVYFHGGGFCIGSAAWSCYHEFLTDLAVKADCVIISVNYRLAPENCLPAAYDDGFNVISWIEQQALNNPGEHKWWLSRCNLSSLFLAGDSAGANIAYHVATSGVFKNPLYLKGIILIQPFFGGESRTPSEKQYHKPTSSALTLSDSDTYWRLALPPGANRDHPWSNPLANTTGFQALMRLPPALVCISEMDILKDRNLEFCRVLRSACKKVEAAMYQGVGHSFQILYNSPMSRVRVQEMMRHLKDFIKK